MTRDRRRYRHRTRLVRAALAGASKGAAKTPRKTWLAAGSFLVLTPRVVVGFAAVCDTTTGGVKFQVRVSGRGRMRHCVSKQSLGDLRLKGDPPSLERCADA